MDKDTQFAAIAVERRSLADLLEELPPDGWEHPSLCTEWRVRDVAAHVAMTPLGAPGTAGIVAGLVRARGDLFGFARDVAIEHARRPTDAIVAELRDHADSRLMPPVTNYRNILLDVIVHGQDIAVPLGIDRPVPTAAGVSAFERAWSMGWPFHARKRLRGLRLVATDAPVDVGEGPALEGPLAALLQLVTGRTGAAAERLRGPGVGLLPA